MTEAQLQRAVAKVLDASGLLWQHSPNEGKRNARTGAALKAAGMKAGCPDVMVFNSFWSSSKVWTNGLAIELKVGKNKPTATQSKWLFDLESIGWRCEVCYTLDAVLDVLRECYPHKFPK
jgi:hypothetical protein